MTRGWLMMLLTLATLGSAAAGDLTVACWNVENMFEWTKDEGRPGSNEERPSEATSRLKMRRDAEIIKELNADIIGLVEVENRHIVRRFVTEYLDNAYPHFILIDEQDPRGIDTALISKRPFLARSFEVPGFPRGILACRFMIEGEPFYILVNHWKSRRSDNGQPTEPQRIACAKRVIEIVTKEIPSYEGRKVPVAIMGDLNDDDGDPSVKLLSSEGGMINSFDGMPADKRWTLPFHNREKNEVVYNGFDHALISPELKDGKGLEWVSTEVVRPERMTTTRTYNGKQYVWTKRDFRDSVGYSDHYPVRMKLTVKP
jgi:endonuclease/exonuclease/phosphatase family metal-dependent hydrolase